jgi:hypothetical protein
MSSTKSNIAAKYQKMALRLKDVAEELNRARKQEVRPKHLWICGRRSGVEAMRMLSLAMEIKDLEGTHPLQMIFSLINRGEPGDSLPIGKRLPPDQLIWTWTMFTLPWLRKMRPEFFRTDSGVYDFPRIKTNKRGQALNRQGKPVRVKLEKDKSGKVIAGKWIDEAATVIDNYDEADLMAHLRLQYQDWSDGCLALADIFDEQCASADASIRLTDSEKRVHEVILTAAPDEGVTGREIAARLARSGYAITQATLTRHIIPKLRDHRGLKNRKGVGYYYDRA